MPIPARPARIALALLGLYATGVMADDGPDTEPERVVVIATRTERPLADVAASVSAMDDIELQQQLVTELSDLFRYLPGLNVDQGGTRFGSTGISIRGIGDNRVAILLDGVPVPDQFKIGSYSHASRDLVELGLIQRVEILRGPASTLYGSDAVGGVVSFHTLAPADLLRDSDRQMRIRASYDGSDDGRAVTAIGALGNEQLALLLAVGERKGHERDHSASSEKQDHRDYQHQSALAHLSWQVNDHNAVQLLAEKTDKQSDSDNQSLLGYARFATTTVLRGDDSATRDRYSLGWHYLGEDWQSNLNLFRQSLDSAQRTQEERRTPTAHTGYQRDFYYQVTASGLENHWTRPLQLANSTHHFGLGVALTDSEIREYRDGLQTNLLTGTSTHFILGEQMPLRDFPISDLRELAIYGHDEIRLSPAWEVIPGLRYERYELNSRADAMWQADNPQTELADIDESALTGKLGVVWHLLPQQSLYLQYAEGFRSPPVEDANIGFYIPMLHFRALPNPALKPEQSQTVELGWRGRSGPHHWELNFFETRFEDFIESRVNLGVDPDTGDTLFQSQNITRARIRGIEASTDWQLLRAEAGVLALQASLFYGRGDNQQTDQPLNSMPPRHGMLGVRWESAGAPWQVALNSRFAGEKDRIDDSNSERYAVSGYAVFDTVLNWQPLPNLHIDAGIFNLFDKTWWQWNDVYALEAEHPAIPLLSQPGRYGKLSASWTF